MTRVEAETINARIRSFRVQVARATPMNYISKSTEDKATFPLPKHLPISSPPFSNKRLPLMLLQTPPPLQLNRNISSLNIPTIRCPQLMTKNVSTPNQNTITPSKPGHNSILASPTRYIGAIICVFLKDSAVCIGRTIWQIGEDIGDCTAGGAPCAECRVEISLREFGGEIVVSLVGCGCCVGGYGCCGMAQEALH